jgi:hypothetical protein
MVDKGLVSIGFLAANGVNDEGFTGIDAVINLFKLMGYPYFYVL